MRVEVIEKDFIMHIESLADLVDQMRVLASVGKSFYVREIVYNAGDHEWEIIINNE